MGPELVCTLTESACVPRAKHSNAQAMKNEFFMVSSARLGKDSSTDGTEDKRPFSPGASRKVATGKIDDRSVGA